LIIKKLIQQPKKPLFPITEKRGFLFYKKEV